MVKAGYLSAYPSTGGYDTNAIYNMSNTSFTRYQLKSGGTWQVADDFQLRAGDIIVNVTHENRWASGVSNYGGHTYMVMSDGTLSGGVTTGEAYGANGVAWANQVATYTRSKSGGCPISSRGYCRLYRPYDSGSGDTPTTSIYTWSQKGNYSGTTVNNNYSLTEEQKLANAHLIYERLHGYGWSDCAIAGLLGNVASEGLLNPDCWNYYPNKSSCGMTNTDGGYGICQWTPATKYTNSSYCPSNRTTNATANGNGQVDFLNSYEAQWLTVNGYTYSDFKANNESPEKSAKDFACFYEGHCKSYDVWISNYGSTSWNARQTRAREWYNKIVNEDWLSGSGNTGEYNTTSGVAMWYIMHKKGKW